VNLYINGYHARQKIIELQLAVPFEWLPDSRSFVIKKLTFFEASKIQKLLQHEGLRASMDSGIFGSAH